jgi:hypothetical protein
LGLFNEWLLETSIHCRGCLIAADRFHWVLTLKINDAEGLQQKEVRGLMDVIDVGT